MNTKNKILAGLFSMAALFSSCNDFQEINEDPNQVDESKVKPEWFLNASIVGDQMNPEIAERMFILTWNRASRFNRGSGFTIGTDNNDYITRYLSNDYAVKWLNQATKAVQLGEKKVADGEADLYPYYKNVIQMARIWRAYLNSEVSDGFGPIPALDAFSGVPGEYDSVEAIYTFILKELKEAEAALDPSIDMSPMSAEDAFYAGNVNMWKKYANSLRMRLAMRIVNANPQLAEREFEDAASKGYISSLSELASVQEKDGWSDLVRTIIVDSTVTCRMKRSDVIDNANIRPGDVIVGLASYGKATYEKEYNGGMGSNGLTSARHDVFSKYLAEKYPESYDKAVPEELVYSGKLKLTDSVEDSPLDAGKLVLSPTRTYAPVVKKLLDALRPQIHGMVHCSGGAQTKVLHFVGDNCRVIKDNLFPVPPLFKTIKEQSDTDWSEMYKVFNMGHRLEVYLSPEHAEEVIAISKSFNIDAQIVGRVEESDKKELIIKSEFGEFKY